VTAADARLDVALETSRREVSLALRADALVLADDDPGSARPHASDLLARLERLLARAGAAPRRGRLALTAVFVGLGPGSYTGLRVGIATAQGLARASGATLHGLPSFEVLAFAALAPGEEARVALDARGGRFYHARYRRTELDVEVREAPEALAAVELVERCRRGGELLLAEPGLPAAAGLPDDVRLRSGARPTASALLALGRARVAAGALPPAQALEPLYLARFGAR
jgi:tRNA threonylcarbamoyladenosine biosynthesis protein TsaB